MGISGGRCHDLTTVMGMPPAPVDPDRLRSLGAALGPLRTCAGEGADEVLSQFPELGDRETQAALDGWVEQLADLLREVEASASDLADRLRISGLTLPEPSASPSASAAPAEPHAPTRAQGTPGERFR